jgi:hypothetical protein
MSFVEAAGGKSRREMGGVIGAKRCGAGGVLERCYHANRRKCWRRYGRDRGGDVTDVGQDRKPSAAKTAFATIVDAIGRFGAVTTSVVLRSEPPKPISRELILAAQRK